MPFSEELKARITDRVNNSETKQSALIPILHEVQDELGHISNESMEEIAATLNLSPACVQNVVTFYTMYFNEHYIGDKLNIKTGQTTPDGKITFMEAECLAACGTAPVMLVDDDLHENLTKNKVDSILESLKRD
jgi:NADH-quinone oxidoreductase subunit E